MPGVARSDGNEPMIAEDEYFFSLIRKANPKKKRNCLKCGVSFLSANYGNRTCGSCAAQNARAAVRAGQVY